MNCSSRRASRIKVLVPLFEPFRRFHPARFGGGFFHWLSSNPIIGAIRPPLARFSSCQFRLTTPLVMMPDPTRIGAPLIFRATADRLPRWAPRTKLRMRSIVTSDLSIFRHNHIHYRHHRRPAHDPINVTQQEVPAFARKSTPREVPRRRCLAEFDPVGLAGREISSLKTSFRTLPLLLDWYLHVKRMPADVRTTPDDTVRAKQVVEGDCCEWCRPPLLHDQRRPRFGADRRQDLQHRRDRRLTSSGGCRP
ncbi:hypothetical protein FBZ94_104549 [Bradyrhizobium sacchari]|uniref:Uncharacterized protein n=1 Tax=Bradyrhizobium sacchari TaxID=1399419 RepID=A0A560IQ01_9BRAD|nr:hypothetical protein FBZ94_104549 [Bradyrhizobium sacchari]TWB73865.1 hypothetical protein FBZ95_105116 [Bradyrhizobium sacchari]